VTMLRAVTKTLSQNFSETFSKRASNEQGSAISEQLD
jgi:hypothetical protein